MQAFGLWNDRALRGLRNRMADLRLPEKENSDSHGARPVHLIISMVQWIRTIRLQIHKFPSGVRGIPVGHPRSARIPAPSRGTAPPAQVYRSRQKLTSQKLTSQKLTSLKLTSQRISHVCVAPRLHHEHAITPCRSPVPHCGVRSFRQKSTCVTQLTCGPNVVQFWSRNPRLSEATKLSSSTVR